MLANVILTRSTTSYGLALETSGPGLYFLPNQGRIQSRDQVQKVLCSREGSSWCSELGYTAD